MSVEYAPKGIVGVLTPQANTTVEPEYAILTPPGYAFLNARLLSPHKTIEERLVDYFANVQNYAREFANAPIGTLCVATTGMSYLVGKEAEDKKLAEMSAALGIPVMTAATSVCLALDALKAKRIALISPYEGNLDAAATPYWESRGYKVVEKVSAAQPGDNFHPIYSLPSGAAQEALDKIKDPSLDAIVMLGTGMPTFGPIARTPFLGKTPVLSCMFALIWANIVALDKREPTGEDLHKWLNGRWWRDRMAQQFV
jgi:maleate isomerase